MKRINITLVSPSKVLSAYKSDSEYQAWIDACIAAGVWGATGNYSIEILDASSELEAKRNALQTATKSEFDSHANNTSNPHSVTKSQVGLASVPDIDATLRSSHTGTQLASTISDFNEAAQDAVGNALLDSADINFSYPDVDNQISAELTTTGVVAGTYSLVSVDSKGRITAGSNTGSVTRYSYATSSTTSNSNATYTSVAQLTTASLPTGLYKFSFFGRMQSGATANGSGVRISAGTATITTVNAKWFLTQATNTSGSNTVQNINYTWDQTDATTNVVSGQIFAANTTFNALGEGVVRITTAGSLAIQIRSDANGSASSLLADSVLILELV